MDEVGMRIVQEKKAALIAEMGGQFSQIDKRSVGGKDLISLLLQANLAADATQRLSDEEVLGRECRSPIIVYSAHAHTFQRSQRTRTLLLRCA